MVVTADGVAQGGRANSLRACDRCQQSYLVPQVCPAWHLLSCKGRHSGMLELKAQHHALRCSCGSSHDVVQLPGMGQVPPLGGFVQPHAIRAKQGQAHQAQPHARFRAGSFEPPTRGCHSEHLPILQYTHNQAGFRCCHSAFCCCLPLHVGAGGAAASPATQ